MLLYMDTPGAIEIYGLSCGFSIESNMGKTPGQIQPAGASAVVGLNELMEPIVLIV